MRFVSVMKIPNMKHKHKQLISNPLACYKIPGKTVYSLQFKVYSLQFVVGKFGIYISKKLTHALFTGENVVVQQI